MSNSTGTITQQVSRAPLSNRILEAIGSIHDNDDKASSSIISNEGDTFTPSATYTDAVPLSFSEADAQQGGVIATLAQAPAAPGATPGAAATPAAATPAAAPGAAATPAAAPRATIPDTNTGTSQTPSAAPVKLAASNNPAAEKATSYKFSETTKDSIKKYAGEKFETVQAMPVTSFQSGIDKVQATVNALQEASIQATSAGDAEANARIQMELGKWMAMFNSLIGLEQKIFFMYAKAGKGWLELSERLA